MSGGHCQNTDEIDWDTVLEAAVCDQAFQCSDASRALDYGVVVAVNVTGVTDNTFDACRNLARL